MRKVFFLLPWICTGFFSCAHLHNVEIGEIDTSSQAVRFDLKVSETGVDVEQAARIASAINPRLHKASNAVSSAWKMISYGPKTGEVTFSDTYADDLPTLIAGSCNSGSIGGLAMYRETMKYPVISGEMVHVVGYCRTGVKQ